jgi:hypothetical protein
MLHSIAYQSLGIAARRVLDFLIVEHLNHGGKENGRLGATYLQLERFGVTKRDIAKAFAELFETGFVRLTAQGLRQAGGGEPSRYALTWLPTLMGSPEQVDATDDWREVAANLRKKGMTTVRQARAWLKAEVARPAKPKTAGPARDIEGSPQVRREGRLQVRGGNGAAPPLK